MKKLFSLYLAVLLITIPAASAVSIENLKKLNITETDLWDPVLSPSGTEIAYVAYDSARNQQIFVTNLSDGEVKKITTGAFRKWGLAWGPEKIAYVSFGKEGLEKIFVINPDGSDNKQLILDDTRQGNQIVTPAWAAPSWSHDGRFLVYTSLDDVQEMKMYMVNADGTGKRLVFNDTFEQWSPSFSPDGMNIVYVSYSSKFKEELFILDVERKVKRQLTFDEIKKNNPVWGPESTIAYVSYENVTSSTEKIFAINQDGTDRRLFVDSDYKQRSPSWSLDGSKFSYAAIDASGIVKIAIGDVAGIIPAATPTPAPTVIVTETLPPTPAPAETPATEETPALKEVVVTLLLVIVIIVIVMLALLAISDIIFKK